MDPRISMIGLGVGDLNRAIRFYGDGLGLPRYPFEGDIAFFQTASTWLCLYDRGKLADDIGISAKGEGFPGFTLAHNVGSKAEVEQVMAEAETAGAVIVAPAEDKFWGGYSGYFTDPDGFYWEIAWNPFLEIK